MFEKSVVNGEEAITVTTIVPKVAESNTLDGILNIDQTSLLSKTASLNC